MRSLALIPYYGGKQARAQWIVTRFAKGQHTWIEAFGGGLSVVLAAIRYHNPATIVVAEKIPALREAYRLVRDKPTEFTERWEKEVRSMRTEASIRGVAEEQHDGDPVRFALACSIRFAQKAESSGVSKHNLRKTLRQPVVGRFGLISKILRRAPDFRVVNDFRQVVDLRGALYADPPYCGKDVAAYGCVWEEQEDRACGEAIAARPLLYGSTIVSTYNPEHYAIGDGWSKLTPPALTSGSRSAIEGRPTTLQREAFLWRD